MIYGKVRIPFFSGACQFSNESLQLSPALTTTAESRSRPLREDVRCWTNGVNKLTKILLRYCDKDSLQQLSEQRERLGDMLGAMGLDDKGRDKMRTSIFLAHVIHSSISS
jgi:hypothetical protein